MLFCRRELCEQLKDMGCVWPLELKAASTAARATLKDIEHAEASETIAKSVSESCTDYHCMRSQACDF